MESFIVVFVIIFLIGAVSFLKPSKKMKALSQVRMAAAKEGFKIGSTNQLRKKFKNWNPQVAIYQFKNLSEYKNAYKILTDSMDKLSIKTVIDFLNEKKLISK